MVIFDLDDTLYSERSYAHSGFAAVAAAFESQLGDRDHAASRMRQLLDTGHRNRVFNTILTERGLSEDVDLIGRMRKTYHTHKPTISLHEDADRLLTRLRARFKLGLITDGPAAMQNNKINALGLRSQLDAIIVTDELDGEFAKPHPHAFEIMAEQLSAACRLHFRR